MLNNKDDEKYEAPDESEYHFSDEESYEAEPEHHETVSEKSKTSPMSGLKDRLLGAQSSPSKRMAISLVVFIGLVFVVYKIVAPTSTTSVEIEPATVAAATSQSMTPSQPATPAPAQPASPTVAAQPPAPAPQAQPAPTVAVNPEPQQPVAQTPVAPTPDAMAQTQPAAQPVAPANPAVAAQNALPGAPDIIPVETPAPTTAMNGNPNGNLAAIPDVQQAQSMTAADVKMAEMQANSVKLMSQMQADYAQKIAEFQGQNKILQDQVSSLNSKISVLESQMAQLVQALTRQAQQQAPTLAPKPIPNEPEGSDPQASNDQPQHIAYNVQAIIPGRAWLRSDNGDTLTVAEGDTVKSLGRVTKIDPYDGVVEINTGHKVIALSYGTGA